MFATAVRIERDLGVPSVSLNALTGHRSCAPEDCGRRTTILPQGPAPVVGRLSGGWYLSPSGDWDSGNATFAISRGSPGAPPLTPGHGRRFPGMLFSSVRLSAPSKPSDPGITPLIPARCPGDTAVRLMAH